MECKDKKHNLKLLSAGVSDIRTSFFNGTTGTRYPPVYQCVDCKKVFKLDGEGDDYLTELPIF